MTPQEFTPAKQDEGAIEITTSASFKSLMSALNLTILRDYRGFLRALPAIMASTPQAREPMWAFCQLPGLCFSFYTSREWENNHTSVHVGPTVRGTWARTHHPSPALHKLPFWVVVLGDSSGRSLGIHVNSEQISNNSWEVCIFPFLQSQLSG